MVLVNGGYFYCTDKEILVNSSLKGAKKMARVISKTQVSDPGPSWPSCFYKFIYMIMAIQFIEIQKKKFLWKKMG